MNYDCPRIWDTGLVWLWTPDTLVYATMTLLPPPISTLPKKSPIMKNKSGSSPYLSAPPPSADEAPSPSVFFFMYLQFGRASFGLHLGHFPVLTASSGSLVTVEQSPPSKASYEQ
jgi:hypothetical protein